jgi:hypothetical protein
MFCYSFFTFTIDRKTKMLYYYISKVYIINISFLCTKQ